MLKILVAIGTRPEAIKLAPVITELKRFESIQTRVIITSQHKEVLQQSLDVFKHKYDYDLNVMQPNQPLTYLLSRIIQDVQPVLISYNPDWVLVQGDTTSALALALASVYNKIPIGHIEAGLRTHDFAHPFPEEINRHLIDHVAKLCFAPTETAKRALVKENISPDKIHVTGNTVVDALNYVCAQPSIILPLQLSETKRILLVTIHRRENQSDSTLQKIFRSLIVLSQRNDVIIVFVVHPNPKIKDVAYRQLGNYPNIVLVPPLDYLSFIKLIDKSYFILTDSGGIQEEAPYLGKPVLVVRTSTERTEAVEAGVVQVIGTNKNDIIYYATRLLEDQGLYNQMRKNSFEIFGDGKASKHIVQILLDQQTNQS